MKKIRESAALLLIFCMILSLSACGTKAIEETSEASGAAAVPAATAPQETVPSDAEIAAELMGHYLTQSSYGVAITTDYGVSMAHSGEPVQSWSVYLSDDQGQIRRTFYHPVIKDQPSLEKENPDAPTPAEVIQDLRESLKAGETGKGTLSDYMVNDRDGVYCFIVEEGEDLKVYNAALTGYAWSHPFCWLQKETQKERLQKVLEDPERAAEFFSLSEETFQNQNCLCVSYEMDSSLIKVMEPVSFEKLFRAQDNEYIQARRVQPVLRPGSPVAVKAYFDPETGFCLGETLDATAAAGRLMDMLATGPNITDGSGNFVTEKVYLKDPLEDVPVPDYFPKGERKNLHRIDLRYGPVTNEVPPSGIQSTYELVLDPIVQMFSVRDNGKEIALLCPYLYFGQDIWDQYDLRNYFVTEQEKLESSQYNIDLNTVSMAEVFHYPTLRDQKGYVVRIRLKNHNHGAEIFAWDRETAIQVAQSLTIS